MSYVLLVEDDPCNRAVIEDIFEFDEPDAEIVCVESGEEALVHVNERHPSLILMDIRLPGIDGLETTKRIKDDEHTRGIPIWALTAHAMRGDRERAIEIGFDDYVTKPIDTKDFKQRLHAFLHASEKTTCQKS